MDRRTRALGARVNTKTTTPTRANTPRGIRLRVLVDWTDTSSAPDLNRTGGVHGGAYYEGPGMLIAWPPGSVPCIRLPGGTRVHGSECW